MEWTDRQILDTLRLIEESDYDEVRLETENFKLHVRKSGMPPQLDHGPASFPPAATPHPQPQAATREIVASAPAVPSAARSKDAFVPNGMIAIRAPMIGTFYGAPAPHLPPYVQAGATVQADDTVCLIEVMKLFNTLKAGVAGRVVRFLVENGTMVEYDQPLLLIDPAAKP